jgi:pseudaminic acid cytidylyltransferase
LSNVAVIPARGGSKRIPRKNIRDFLDKPIIAYSIETALESGLFDEVMVSTDDEEIARVAEMFGAALPFFRSEEAADDYATLADVIEDVKSQYHTRERSFDYICCILATAPLLKMEHLMEGYKLITEGDVDSVRPVVQFPYPIQRAFKLENGRVEMFNKEFARTRSQDLEPAYYDAGQFYWMKYDMGLKGPVKGGFEISGQFVQDIDDEEDWKIAELKYRLLKKLENGE